MISAKVIADSISPNDARLTTMEWTYPRFIHSEVMTHRLFSRNSASSRAIPVFKIIEQVRTNPAVPIRFPKNQPGMVGGEDLNQVDRDFAEGLWIGTGHKVAESAQIMLDMNIHKSVVNRMLEPWMWYTIVVSSTEWDNFFVQRISPDAQPEINDLAVKANDALRASVPQRVDFGGWHLPYVTAEEQNPFRSDLNLEMLRALSVSRVAGSSYGRLGKTREIEKDLALYWRLREANPPHWSPFEHVATPAEVSDRNVVKGNFTGWYQLRHLLDE